MSFQSTVSVSMQNVRGFCSVRKVFLKFRKFKEKHWCLSLQLYFKKILTQLFSCEFCKIFKSKCFYKKSRWLFLNVTHTFPIWCMNVKVYISSIKFRDQTQDQKYGTSPVDLNVGENYHFCFAYLMKSNIT